MGKNEKDPSDGNPQQQDAQQPGPTDGDDAKKGQAPAPKPTSKEEARRLLQGLRSRERPLSPLEMRGSNERTPAPDGKDW
jgi:hypothetical protein